MRYFGMKVWMGMMVLAGCVALTKPCYATEVGGSSSTSCENERDNNFSEIGEKTHTTVYEGVDYSAVYDYDYYVLKYPDVYFTYGDSDEMVLHHFVEYGMDEGRQGNEEFNVQNYIWNYENLRAEIGYKYKDYYLHYMNIGKDLNYNATEKFSRTPETVYDGVDYSAVYDYDYYLEKYPDVEYLRYETNRVLEHFVQYGMNEGRQGNEEFNVMIYLENYPELGRELGWEFKDLYIHYMNYGKNEGYNAKERIERTPVTVYEGVDYAPVYNYEYYVEHYPNTSMYVNDEKSTLKYFVEQGMWNGEQGSEEFNVLIYIENYGELFEQFGFELKEYYLHYINEGKRLGYNASESLNLAPTTVLDGVDYSAVYDYNYYIEKYPNENDRGTRVLQNFVTEGMREGRQGSEEFNVIVYIENYPELEREYGMQLEKYYLHYINIGKSLGYNAITRIEKEPTTIYNGVDYKAVYNYNFYMERYPDVAFWYRGDEKGAIRHFVEYGMREGRQGNAEFNVIIYMNNYLELRNKYGYCFDMYYQHYMNTGKSLEYNATTLLEHEPITVYNGVDYKAVYNYEYYLRRYPDVALRYGEDEQSALFHFVEYGMREGRQGNEEFNVVTYLYNYPEVERATGWNYAEAYLHYINTGKALGYNAATKIEKTPVTVFNGVDYSAVYDYEYYYNRYPDIAVRYGISDEAALYHFVMIGMNEGRQGNKEFNPMIYKQNYPEVYEQCYHNFADLYQHYMNIGKSLGYQASTLIEQEPITVFEGVDYSAVYDYEYYLSRYPEVAAQYGTVPEVILYHFVTTGMMKGYQGKETFNIIIYRNEHPELVPIYRNNLKSYYIYYIEHRNDVSEEVILEEETPL